jgi:hypothetical protein
MLAGLDLIKRTRQGAKLYVGVTLLLAGGGVSAFGPTLARHLSPDTFAAVILSAVVAGFGGLIFLCTSIRCPTCGAKWLWLLASRRTGDPLHWTLASDMCTACGAKGPDAV